MILIATYLLHQYLTHKFSYNNNVLIKRLTKRDSYMYFTDFDQLLHDYSEE